MHEHCLGHLARSRYNRDLGFPWPCTSTPHVTRVTAARAPTHCPRVHLSAMVKGSPVCDCCWVKARLRVKRCCLIFLAGLLLATASAAQQSPATPGKKHVASAKAAAPAKMGNDECLACHNDPTLSKDENGKQISLHVDDAKFKGSIHSVFGCTDCHTDIKAFPHDPTPKKPVCATCHADQQAAYDRGVHAKAAAAGNTNVAKCQDCHGSVHEILPASDPKSKVAHANIPQTCGACHGQKFVMASSGMSSAPFTSYQQSVHGKDRKSVV